MAITKASSNAVAPAAKGDLVVGNATNDSGVLAVGSTDQVLTVDSSTATGLKWATPSSGSMTLISTTTLTGASVTLSSIPATYKDLKIIIQNYKPATDGAVSFGVELNGDSAARYNTVNFGIGNSNLTFNENFWQTGGQQDNAVSYSLIQIDIPDYTNTVTWKMGASQGFMNNQTTSTNFNSSTYGHIYNQTSAVSSLKFFPYTGSFTSGTALLYGVK